MIAFLLDSCCSVGRIGDGQATVSTSGFSHVDVRTESRQAVNEISQEVLAASPFSLSCLHEFTPDAIFRHDLSIPVQPELGKA